ncbi:MAG: S8 family serine peptidase [Ignavibacteriaceae bacterium]|nr:S8 family serine peptidase [Ignavibacteriaceae bacterium]
MRSFVTFSLFLMMGILLHAQPRNYVPGELLVQMKAGKTPGLMTMQNQSAGLTIKELIADEMNIWLIGYDESVISDAAALSLVKNYEDVYAAQFNHYISHRPGVPDNGTASPWNSPLTTTPNDPRFAEQWGLNNTGQSGGTPDADIDAPEAWDFHTGGLTALGDTVVVAVVDGGFDLNHQDLNYYKNWRDIPGNGLDDDQNGYIDDYNGWNAYDQNGNIPSDQHGTHVAGIVGAKGNNALGVSGVNWNVKVMAVAGSSGQEAIVLRAYNYILKMRKLYNQTNGQQGAFVVATNASFGVDYGQPSNYPLWCAVYDSLGVQGVLSCGATANANVNVDLQGDIPTACASDFLVSVTNTTRTDAKNSGAAYGLTTIDLGAPGSAVLSTVPNNGYSSLTGTSMATPMVSGAIGLMFAAANPQLMSFYKLNPALGALQFKEYLLSSTDPIPALNGITVTGGRLNIYKALLAIAVPPDTIAPTRVQDLAASEVTSSSVRLQWTTPLDTTRNGVAGYDIRYAVTPITDSASFNAALPVSYSHTPDTTGAPVSAPVSGLTPNTTYYFALRAYDIWANWSDISNVVSVTTWQAPVFSAVPDSMFHYLNLNGTRTDSVVISNISLHQSTMEWSVTFENNTFPAGSLKAAVISSVTRSEDNRLQVKQNPPQTFGAAGRGSGGPDAFGYTWIDSDEPSGPAFVWNDISATGTELTNWISTGTFGARDEGYSGPVALPFNFKFYGETQNAVYVSSNGMILFAAPTANNFTNANLPTSTAPNGIIAPFWDDLDGTNGGKVYTKQEGNTFVIQYNNWPRYSTTGSALTFQVVLHQSGKIVFYYKTMTSSTLNSATVGIENLTGTVGLPVAFNAVYVKNNHAVAIQAEPDWLQAQNFSGMLYNGNSASVVLTFNASDFPQGLYSMDMKISSTDPAVPVKTVPVVMWASGVIPVELSSFRTEAEKGAVHIYWSTATETNNESFIIERKKKEGEWTAAGTVQGRGTTTQPAEYRFTDYPETAGTYYYRLKQRDFDGTVRITAEGEVLVGMPSVISLGQNYPNPFNPATRIDYQIPSDSKVVIEIYEMTGQKIATLLNAEQSAGYYSLDVSAGSHGLSSGIYLYRLTAVEEESGRSITLSRKMVILK